MTERQKDFQGFTFLHSWLQKVQQNGWDNQFVAVAIVIHYRDIYTENCSTVTFDKKHVCDVYVYICAFWKGEMILEVFKHKQILNLRSYKPSILHTNALISLQEDKFILNSCLHF